MIAAVLRYAGISAVLYVTLQITTGIIVGVWAAALVVRDAWPLASALAFTIPMGIPLIIFQLAFLSGIYHVRDRVLRHTNEA